MTKIINASIDLTKIEKSKIVAHENGSLYYSIQIFVNDEPDQYGNDVAIKETLTKKELEEKVKSKYIGNGRTAKPKTVDEQKAKSAIDDLPF